MIAFVGGFFLDLIMGDPYNFPHPVRWIGRLISAIEKHDLGEEDTKALSGAANAVSMARRSLS